MLTALFFAAELILYGLILTQGGNVLVWSSFGAIALCFLYGLKGKGSRFLKAGLLCTVLADFCLVVCSPIQRLPGMIFFLCAQSFYALYLHRQKKSKPILRLRQVLVVVVVLVAVLVLRKKTDALVIVSVCYYVLLITNMIHAFSAKERLFGVALCLFILCDTVIGLQVAAGTYLPINEGSALYKIIFTDFNLAWFFYLPSQVLIAKRTWSR